MTAVRTRIDNDWLEVRRWQAEAERPRNLIDVAARFVRRRSQSVR